MASYLERYLAGEHEQVWAELTAFGGAVRREPLLSEATLVATKTMRRARHNIEILIPRLTEIGYQFGALDDGSLCGFVDGDLDYDSPMVGYPGPLQPPPLDIKAQISQLEAITGPVPLSLRAWYEVVGAVNFGGWHPRWEVPYHDPLWVDPLNLEYALSEHEEWEQQCEEEGPEEVGPFLLPLAPDYYHKQNVSGGGPYGIELPDAAADAPFDGTPFVDYLRTCFRWGGFPGFDMVRENEGRPLADIAYLTRDLLPI